MNLFPHAGPLRKHLGLPVAAQADFEQYRGGHTNKKWVQVGPEWCCPSCRRTKFQQLTWTVRRIDGRVIPNSHGWLAPIVEHHDHGADEGQRSPRFAPTFICFDCNIAEGRAKKMLKLPKDFSFSPVELSMFIVGYPHRRITEDLESAQAIAESILRFRLW